MDDYHVHSTSQKWCSAVQERRSQKSKQIPHKAVLRPNLSIEQLRFFVLGLQLSWKSLSNEGVFLFIHKGPYLSSDRNGDFTLGRLSVPTRVRPNITFQTTIGSLLESQTKVNEFPSLVVERQRNEVE